MGEEISVINNRKVWVLTTLLPNTEPLECRWVYSLKRDDKGHIAWYKVRLAAQGYRQIKVRHMMKHFHL